MEKISERTGKRRRTHLKEAWKFLILYLELGFQTASLVKEGPSKGHLTHEPPVDAQQIDADEDGRLHTHLGEGSRKGVKANRGGRKEEEMEGEEEEEVR